MDQLYRNIFKGTFVAGTDEIVAKSNLRHLLKNKGSSIDPLFDDKPLVLKTGVSENTARRYQLALEQAGIIIDIEPHSSDGVPGEGHTGDGR